MKTGFHAETKEMKMEEMIEAISDEIVEMGENEESRAVGGVEMGEMSDFPLCHADQSSKNEVSRCGENGEGETVDSEESRVIGEMNDGTEGAEMRESSSWSSVETNKNDVFMPVGVKMWRIVNGVKEDKYRDPAS